MKRYPNRARRRVQSWSGRIDTPSSWFSGNGVLARLEGRAVQRPLFATPEHVDKQGATGGGVNL